MHKDGANIQQQHSLKHPLSLLQISLGLLRGVISVSQSVYLTDTQTQAQGCTALIHILSLFVAFSKSSLVTTHELKNCSNISSLRASMLKYLSIKTYDNVLIACTVITNLTKLFNERFMPQKTTEKHIGCAAMGLSHTMLINVIYSTDATSTRLLFM